MSEKKKFKFNILDVIIILVAVACIAGSVARYLLPEKIGIANSKSEEAILTFYLTNIRTDTIDNFIEGDEYYLYNTVFGTLYNVSEFKIEPHKVYGEDANGLVRESTIAHRSDITGYFKIKGEKTDTGFLLEGGEKISSGYSAEVYSPNRRMTLFVENIEVVE